MDRRTIVVELVEAHGAEEALTRAMCECGWRGDKHFSRNEGTAIGLAEDDASGHVRNNGDRRADHLLRTDGPLTVVVKRLSESTAPLAH
jgi:hypothetical protein